MAVGGKGSLEINYPWISGSRKRVKALGLLDLFSLAHSEKREVVAVAVTLRGWRFQLRRRHARSRPKVARHQGEVPAATAGEKVLLESRYWEKAEKQGQHNAAAFHS